MHRDADTEPKSSGPHNRLLVVDDEEDIAGFVAEVASDLGYAVETTGSADAFMRLVRDFAPTLVVMDLSMPEADGIELLRYLAENGCRARILVASGMDARVLATAERLGEQRGLAMQGTLQKPMTVESLEAELRKAMVAPSVLGEADLAAAIEHRQLEVHYQPKVSFEGGVLGRIVGCEALVRWNHPDRGLVSPGLFIPLAEDTGLISGVTEVVLDTAVEQAARWRAAGHDVSVAVNLTSKLLDDLDLPDRMASVLARHSVPPKALVAEITESAAMSDAAHTMDVLTRIRVKGIGLSIDDFGTGYSSLVQLYRMPFDELKIDKSFVLDATGSREAATIVGSLTDMAHGMGLSVCAEGFEDEDTLAFLLGAGSDRGQGFHVSKPLPAADATRFLADWNASAEPRPAKRGHRVA